MKVFPIIITLSVLILVAAFFAGTLNNAGNFFSPSISESKLPAEKSGYDWKYQGAQVCGRVVDPDICNYLYKGQIAGDSPTAKASALSSCMHDYRRQNDCTEAAWNMHLRNYDICQWFSERREEGEQCKLDTRLTYYHCDLIRCIWQQTEDTYCRQEYSHSGDTYLDICLYGKKFNVGEYQCDSKYEYVIEDKCVSVPKSSTCPNGEVDSGEECDDGNYDPNDACNNCKKTFCGDGIVQSQNGDGQNENCEGEGMSCVTPDGLDGTCKDCKCVVEDGCHAAFYGGHTAVCEGPCPNPEEYCNTAEDESGGLVCACIKRPPPR